jgi:acetyl-CoA acyltransferase 2
VTSASRDLGLVFLSGARTGFGAFGGALRDLSATDLGAAAARAALERSGLEHAAVDHVIFGNVLQTSADAPYLARHVGLRAGLPAETPALTVNRLCGSGFEAVIQGARQILLGESRVVLAGGTESMSQALWEALRDSYCGLSMAETAERLAEQHRIGREAVDCYAARSQMRAKAGWDAGAFADEVVPVMRKDPKTRQEVAWAADEHMRPDTTVEALAKLPPYFRKDGVVTAGNASGICDGAAALVVASEDFARERGLRPIGRLVGWGIVGVDPVIVGIGPVPASRRALAAAGLTLADMDLVEINEAFAAQYLAVEQELGLDRERTNVDGGAVALGHPLGATGARLTLHLLCALRRRRGRYGLAAACIGGGQGAAVVVEALAA